MFVFVILSLLEVIAFDVGAEDQFIVLASDGVWEFISNEEVIIIFQLRSFKSLLIKNDISFFRTLFY